MRIVYYIFIITQLLWSSFSTAPLVANEGPVGTYRQRMDPEWRKKHYPGWGTTFTKDNNVWVYTSKFQKRFGMPPRWTDDGLTGAEAVVWRLEPVGRRRCHGEGEERECLPSYECVLESYIKNDTTNLIFEHELAFKPWKGSVAVLAMNHSQIKERYNRAFGGPSGGVKVGDGKKLKNMRLDVLQYHTKMRKHLIQIGSLADCRAGLAEIKAKRVVEYFNPNEKTIHQVDVPTSFWKRVHTYHNNQPEITSRNWLGGREEDNNIWVYSADFAKRFNLPVHNINDELKGAEAIAFRVEPKPYQFCGYFGSDKNCIKVKDEAFDLYLSKDAKMSYQSDQIMDGLNTTIITNNLFLREQDLAMKVDRYKNKNPITEYLGYVSYVYKYKYGLLNSKLSDWGGHGGVFVNHFIKPNVWFDNIGLVTLHEYSTSKKQIHNHFVFTEETRSAPSANWAFDNAIHKIKVPSPFIHLTSHYKETYKKTNGSLWQLVQDHYKGIKTETINNTVQAEEDLTE